MMWHAAYLSKVLVFFKHLIMKPVTRHTSLDKTSQDTGFSFATATYASDHRITESQNNRMFGVGRDLCGSSSATLLPKQGYLQ